MRCVAAMVVRDGEIDRSNEPVECGDGLLGAAGSDVGGGVAVGVEGVPAADGVLVDEDGVVVDSLLDVDELPGFADDAADGARLAGVPTDTGWPATPPPQPATNTVAIAATDTFLNQLRTLMDLLPISLLLCRSGTDNMRSGSDPVATFAPAEPLSCRLRPRLSTATWALAAGFTRPTR